MALVLARLPRFGEAEASPVHEKSLHSLPASNRRFREVAAMHRGVRRRQTRRRLLRCTALSHVANGFAKCKPPPASSSLQPHQSRLPAALGWCACKQLDAGSSRHFLRIFSTPSRIGFSSVHSTPALGQGLETVRPNPSLEPTRSGVALGPRGFFTHHPPRGPSATPALAAQLKR